MDHVRNDDIIEVQERETEVVWTREETRTRIHRKTDSGDGSTWQKKKRRRPKKRWIVSTET